MPAGKLKSIMVRLSVLLASAQVVFPTASIACTVGNGSIASCTEDNFKKCMPGGNDFDGDVDFNCGGPATIQMTVARYITVPTNVQGEGSVTFTGVSIFQVQGGGSLSIDGITIVGGGIGNFGTLSVSNCELEATLANRVAVSNGKGAVATISNTQVRGFSSSVNGGSVLNLGAMTVTGSLFEGNSAQSGAAIYNLGNLVVADTAFDNNTATQTGGGIANQEKAHATIIGSLFTGNAGIGGAVFSAGKLDVIDSWFGENTGSAIFVWSIGDEPPETSVAESTFIENLSGGEGAGIYKVNGSLIVARSLFVGNHAYSGGGVSGSSGLLAITNSTFVGNLAGNPNFPGYGSGGAVHVMGGEAHITNCSFLDNSAPSGNDVANDLYDPGTVRISNSILASDDGATCFGEIVDGGHNISGARDCGFSGPGCLAAGGTSQCDVDPRWDPRGLRDNGGATHTVGLCSGLALPVVGCAGASPALNAGNNELCSESGDLAAVSLVDQRGFPRPGPNMTQCSIGAFEGAVVLICGDRNSDGSVTAADALGVLKAAVGAVECPVYCVCDPDASGSISSGDALATLRIAVGRPSAANCDCA